MSVPESSSSSTPSLQFTAFEYGSGQYQQISSETTSDSSSVSLLEDVQDIRRPFSPPPPSFVTVEYPPEQRPAPDYAAPPPASAAVFGTRADFTPVTLQYVPTRNTSSSVSLLEDSLDIRRPFSPPPPSFVTVEHVPEQRSVPNYEASSSASASVTVTRPPTDFTPVTLEYVPTRNSVDERTAPNNDDVPLPTYEEVRAATEKVTYSFSQLKFNSMILLPPANAPNSRPLYHIMISMNCFMPMSFITTVSRGGTEYGEHVGDFEMGIIDKSSTMFIRNVEYRLSEVMTRSATRSVERFVWFPRDRRHTFIWEYTPKTKQYSGYRPLDVTRGGKRIVATFHRAPLLTRRSTGPVILPQLEIEPEGQRMFDDILMSLLVIERRKLTPRANPELFN